MLTKFSVSNFKNFKSKIELNLSQPGDYDFNSEAVSEGCVSKGLIYGVNGSGKSNLCLAVFDITVHLTDKMNLNGRYTPYLNMHSLQPNAKFEYEFVFDNVKVSYKYEKTSVQCLVRELLCIDGKEVISFDRETGKPVVRLPGTRNLEKYSPDTKMSIVKYVRRNGKLIKDDPTCAIFLKFYDFVDNMLLFYSLQDTGYQGFETKDTDDKEIVTQTIVAKNKTVEFQKFLKKCGINDFNLCVRTGDDGNEDLFCHFEQTHKDIHFLKVASTGTKSLAYFYYWYIVLSEVPFVMIDEFDAFYHFELSEAIVELLKGFKGKQVLLTTHNTDLMSNDLLRPDCYFLLRNGKVRSLDKITDKDLEFVHNLQRMYKAGFFDE